MKGNIQFNKGNIRSYLYTNLDSNKSNCDINENTSYSEPRWFKEDEEPDWYKDVIKRWKGTASIMPD